MKIEQAERQFAMKLGGHLQIALSELGYSIPTGYQEQINFQDANGRKKRSNASADNWSPESGQIVIRFERAPHVSQNASTSESQVNATEDSPQSASEPAIYVHPAEAELLKALDRTESRPGWTFVPLKKFRDEILPLENCSSIRTDVEREHILRSAIDKKFILKGTVPNPKHPQFPVTTIRVNRLLPEVQALLGGSGNRDFGFHPVEIPGEPLSTTVLRERR